MLHVTINPNQDPNKRGTGLRVTDPVTRSPGTQVQHAVKK